MLIVARDTVVGMDLMISDATVAVVVGGAVVVAHIVDSLDCDGVATAAVGVAGAADAADAADVGVDNCAVCVGVLSNFPPSPCAAVGDVDNVGCGGGSRGGGGGSGGGSCSGRVVDVDHFLPA